MVELVLVRMVVAVMMLAVVVVVAVMMVAVVVMVVDHILLTDKSLQLILQSGSSLIVLFVK